MTLRFAWRPSKADSDKRKHGVSFKTAARVFADPLALSHQDRIEEGEYRWQIIGSVDASTVLLLA